MALPASPTLLQRLARRVFLANVGLPLRLLLRHLCRTRVIGTDNIPRTGRVILASNHTSMADPVVLQVFCPRHLTFLMTERYYQVPVAEWFFRFWGCVPVRESGLNRRALRRGIEALRDGRALGIFPEGRISRDGQTHSALRGVGLLARLGNAPVVPVGLAGIDAFLPPDHWTFRQSTITMVVGQPIPAADAGRADLPERVTQAIRRCVQVARTRSGQPQVPEGATSTSQAEAHEPAPASPELP
ncbi:MAG: 1-acyl-sn-glycerol-3-phosphate acyltransferase [Candidatus Brocadiae bacterium]|nr:1-acyl-sn-glycerol-3-phosphate acyltransferase [Candidatus Brocadiia bacterium]